MKVGDTFQNVVDEIDLRHSANRNKKLLKPLDVRTKLFNKRLNLSNDKAIAFQIPDLYTIDGASVPRFLWWWINPLRWWILFAAIVHDWCWREQYIVAFIVDLPTKKIVKKVGILVITHKMGTRIMLEKMEAFFGGFISRYLVYYTLEIVRIISNKK